MNSTTIKSLLTIIIACILCLAGTILFVLLIGSDSAKSYITLIVAGLLSLGGIALFIPLLRNLGKQIASYIEREHIGFGAKPPGDSTTDAPPPEGEKQKKGKGK